MILFLHRHSRHLQIPVQIFCENMDLSSGILLLVSQPACDPGDIILFFDDLTGLRKINIIILSKIRYPVIHRHMSVCG
jgi:hypothetical protein